MPPRWVGLSLLPRRARAAEWPTRPVKLLVPFAAGGTTDILARVVAAKVSEEFGQQFIVENKTGAGGNIAADAVAKAEPDGYTFLVGTPGDACDQPFVFKNMTFDQIKDIAPVIIIARVPNLCSVTDFAAGEIGRRTDRLCQSRSRANCSTARPGSAAPRMSRPNCSSR